MPGKVIGRYEILEMLGQGTMGHVYRARDPRLGREVAVKVLVPPPVLKSGEWQARFGNDIQAAGRLNHPHIVTIHDVDLEHKPPYLVMELLTGGTLKERLRTQRSLPWHEALILLRPLCQALAYAHRVGVPHRDVRPGNVLFVGGEPQALKLVDFGVPRLHDIPMQEWINQTGLVPGMLAYMSPEQGRGDMVDGRTDIFSVGIILLEALVGYNPLARDTRRATLAEIVSAEPVDTSWLQVPTELIGLIDQAVAKDRSQRYPTCDALLADLDRCLDAQSTALTSQSASLSVSSALPEHPVIQKAWSLQLTPEIEAVLRAMFTDCTSIAVETEFGHGLSGGRAFQISAKQQKKTLVPTVVKTAPMGLILTEWEAYKTWVEGTLPESIFARIESPPISLPGVPWGGLRYSLAGGEVFRVQSLHEYCREASVEQVLEILERLFKPLAECWWLNRQGQRSYQMQAEYDALLPVNLLIQALDLPAHADVCLIEAGHLPPPSLSVGDQVQLKGFVVTEVNHHHRQLTLNLPPAAEGLTSCSYRLRVDNVSDIGRYRVGHVVDSVFGEVAETRDGALAKHAKDALGKAFDPAAKRLNISGRLDLPNPLVTYQAILHSFPNICISTVHRDFNLENILIDEGGRITLIDFATACRGHNLHDLLRLETEVVTKLLSEILARANLPPETIYDFYMQLHCTVCYPDEFPTPELTHGDLERPFEMLAAIRRMARQCLYNQNDWKEYYQGLSLYLLGALKFRNLDELPQAPLPKQVAFWGAAAIQQLLQEPPQPPAPFPTREKTRRLRQMTIAFGAILSLLAVILVVRIVTEGRRPGFPPPPDPPVAVIMVLSADVEIRREGATGLILASFGTPLYPSDMIIAGEGASADIICQNGNWFSLAQQTNLTVDCEDTTDPCFNGQLTSALTKELVLARPYYTDTLSLERTRASRSEQEVAPLLLYPRNTVITNTKPVFQWQPVAGAIGYQLELIPSGGQSWSKQTQHTILSYPTDKPPLRLGSANATSLEALDSSGVKDETWLEVLDETSLARVTEAQALITALDVDETSRRYLLAQLYREWRMWAAATDQLEWLIDHGGVDSAYLFQQLGDLYVRVGLYLQAEENYRMMLDAAVASADWSAQAAAHVGLAQVAHVFGETEAAVSHLTTAEHLFRQTGETEQVEALATARAFIE